MLRKLRARRSTLEATQRQSEYEDYQSDPCGFIERELGCSLTAQQRQVALSIRDHTVTIVQSANSVGKTYVASGIAVWWLRCFKMSKTVTTAAPPLENLKLLLWGEIGARIGSAPADMFADASMGVLHISMDSEWWLTGRAIPQSGRPEEREAKFSGVHAPHLLFIVDEGDAVPNEVYRGIESCMSGGTARLLVLFNPRAAVGPVYRKIRNDQANVITLDALHHPNVVQGIDAIPGAVTREKTVLRITEWSRGATKDEEQLMASGALQPGSDWFTVPAFLDGQTATRDNGQSTLPLVGNTWRKITNTQLSYMVLARFPGQAKNQLINRADVEAAMARWKTWRDLHGDAPPVAMRPIHGQDVAEFGSDLNVACFRYGNWVAPFESWGGVDVLSTADRAAGLARQRDARISFIDGTGVGAGVAPGMRRWWDMHSFTGNAVAVMVASSPTEESEHGRFSLLRDQLWWAVREWLRTDPTAMLPVSEDLADELCTPTYEVKNGKLSVMSKKEMRKVLNRSPDMADALCLTFAPEKEVEAGFSF